MPEPDKSTVVGIWGEDPILSLSTHKLRFWRQENGGLTRWLVTQSGELENIEVYAVFYNGGLAWLVKNMLQGQALDTIEQGDRELFNLPL